MPLICRKVDEEALRRVGAAVVVQDDVDLEQLPEVRFDLEQVEMVAQAAESLERKLIGTTLSCHDVLIIGLVAAYEGIHDDEAARSVREIFADFGEFLKSGIVLEAVIDEFLGFGHDR